MDSSKILRYLADLEQNNNREWFHANNKQYKEACAEFEELVQQFIFSIGQTDSSILYSRPKELTFKLMRDTRFSHDKSPYNPAMRAHISAIGKLPIPVGYYLVVKPGGRSAACGGLFSDMFKDATDMVRGYISRNGEEWEAILTQPDFAKRFTVKGAALKNVPRGYDPAHPQAEYLKNKSWYLEYPLPDDLVLRPEAFLKTATELFVLMQPFNAYLNRALSGFQMPQR